MTRVHLQGEPLNKKWFLKKRTRAVFQVFLFINYFNRILVASGI